MRILFLGLALIFSTQIFAGWDLTSSLDKTRRYNEVTWLTSHNASMSYAGGWMIINQTKSLQMQMNEFGVRALMLDIFYSDEGPVAISFIKKRDEKELVSCHGDCQITSDILRPFQFPRKLKKIFKIIKNFLESNPSEILTVIYEDYVPSDQRVLLTQLLEEEGLTKYMLTDADTKMFKKNPVILWPTLKELVARGKRLIQFSNKGKPFLSQWSWMVENHYNIAEDKGKKCENRGGSRKSLKGQSQVLFNVNHFYDFAFDIHLVHDPNVRFINHGYLNGPLLQKYVDEVCIPKWGRVPNFISVDHANRHGSVYGGIKLGDYINELNQRPRKDYYADETVYNNIYPGGAPGEKKEEGSDE